MPQRSYTYKFLNRCVGKALHRYGLIADGDRILIGVSGGKDSLTLLWSLHERLRRVPIDYQLFGAYIDPGFDGGFADELTAFCRKSGYHLTVDFTDFGLRAHSPENRENPCFLCAWNRRRRLFEIADELGCNKLALGHHKDDMIETLFMNICYAGEISTMLPRQSLFDGRFTVIRPLAMTDEHIIKKFAAEMKFPSLNNPCPSSDTSKRSEIKDMLAQLHKSNKKIRGNIFRAMHHVKLDYLPGRFSDKSG